MKENMSSWRRAGDLLIITLVGQVLTLMATAAALGGLATGQPPAWSSSRRAKVSSGTSILRMINQTNKSATNKVGMLYRNVPITA